MRLLAVCAAALVAACSAPAPWLALLFDIPPDGKDPGSVPVVHVVRHSAATERPQVLVSKEYLAAMIEAKNAGPPPNWKERLDKLPKESAGGTDWVRALDEGLIKPRPGLGSDAEDQPTLDIDVELTPADAADFKATYSHKVHTQLLACANCHTGIFQMEKGADPITMEKIFAGEYCGRCHGKVAFDPATGCPRCHKAMPQ